VTREELKTEVEAILLQRLLGLADEITNLIQVSRPSRFDHAGAIPPARWETCTRQLEFVEGDKAHVCGDTGSCNGFPRKTNCF
jgi:hypothetical protein